MRKISNKIFLNECDEIHNNKYDYSLVNYKKAKDKIKIKIIYCSKNNIDLMRIKYNENIKNKLNNYEPKQSKNWKQKIQTG
jgi:hypothetical protein